MGFIMAVILYFGLRRENARRDAVYGPVEEHSTVSTTDGEKVIVREDPESEEYRKRWGLDGMTREEIVDLGDDVSVCARLLGLPKELAGVRSETPVSLVPPRLAPCVPFHPLSGRGIGRDVVRPGVAWNATYPFLTMYQ
jgi:hypothetical protein